MRSVKASLKKFKRDFLKAAAEGLLVEEFHDDPQLEAWRKEQCDECEHQEFDDGDEICGVCGCFLDIKRRAKTNRNKKGQVVLTHCPKGKWDDKELADMGGKLK